MQKLFSTLWLSLLMASTSLFAQESKGSFSVSLNQDVFFGFYPTVTGGYELSDKINLSYYGIFWTTPSFGTGGGGGLWTEFGAGVSFDAGPLNITPQLGILSGKLLSNGDYGRFFDGIVPNLTVNLVHDKLEGQLYAGYYKSIIPGKTMDDDGELVDVASTNDFLHYWVNLGYKVAAPFSAGLHWEHLYFAPANIDEAAFEPGGAPVGADLYQWAGPYLQFNHPEGHSVRLTAGSQLVDGEGANNSFYKLSATFAF